MNQATLPAGRLRAALLVALVGLCVGLTGCGGVPIDASELQQFREQLLSDLRALELPEVRVDASELRSLREQLLADLKRIDERLAELEAEARERVGRPVQPENAP
jgi:hypothetical protein